jgi:hypothetical protein
VSDDIGRGLYPESAGLPDARAQVERRHLLMLRTSRMPSAMAGTFHVSPSMAGTRATSWKFLGRGRHKDELAFLGSDDEVFAGEQQLAVPVASALPLELAR